jgi:hypothetical protein
MLAASLAVSVVDNIHPRPAPRLSCSTLQHFRSHAPFFSRPTREASQKLYPAPEKSRPQGLATLSTALAAHALGSLFQLPTLLGFSLQSFRSSLVIDHSFPNDLSTLALSYQTSPA